MSFFDKLKEAANTVSDKTNEMVEVNRLKSKISTENASIIDAQKQLGALVYAQFTGGSTLSPEMADLCAKIKASNESIASLNEEIAKVKSAYSNTPAQAAAPAAAAPAPAAPAPAADAPAEPAAAPTVTCPGCGASNPAGTKFCGNCGAKLGE